MDTDEIVEGMMGVLLVAGIIASAILGVMKWL